MQSLRRLASSVSCLVVGASFWACSHSTEPPPSPHQGRSSPPSLANGLATNARTKPTASPATSASTMLPVGDAYPDVAATPQPIESLSEAIAQPPSKDDPDRGLANLDPNDDAVVGPPEALVDCEQRLHAANIRFRPAQLPIIKRKGFVCGAPQVVEYLEGPEHIRYRPHPLVTCQLALALGQFEHVLARTAHEFLGTKVTSISQGGTYSCRAMARFRLVSEHSYANAIDLYAFGLSGGQTVSVAQHFGRPGDTATKAETRFLRTLAQRLFDENVFSVVVTRFFDELHRDHVHVDMAHYRTDGSR